MNDFSPHSPNLFGEVDRGQHKSTLGDRFLIPPFTVLNAREGWWQDRKREWLSLGIQSELGRGGGRQHDEREQPGDAVGGRVQGTSRTSRLTWNIDADAYRNG